MNSSAKPTSLAQKNIPDLPEFVRDLYGARVDLTPNSWILHSINIKAEKLNWSFYESLVSPEILVIIKLFIADTIREKYALDSVYNRFNGLLCCLRVHGFVETLDDITFKSALRVRNKLKTRSIAQGHAFVYFRLLYYWASDRNLLGTDPQIADKISTLQVFNQTGHAEAVLSWDPEEGPLTDEERLSLERTVRAQPAPDFHQTVIMVFYELGYNPKNISLLEERDFTPFATSDGTKRMFALHVPRIKKRSNKRQTIARDISESLGLAIERLISSNQDRWGEADPYRPIFCRSEIRQKLIGTPRERFAYHTLANELSSLVRSFPIIYNVLSPRTGEILRLSPRRLRYTYGTKMAELGTPPTHLAYLMDHSDTRTGMFYYKASPKIVDRLDKAVGEKAAPIWRWFLGQGFIPKEGNDNPNTIIQGLTPTFRNVGNLGKCGNSSLCQLNPPLTCYICPKFNPFVEGPHSEYLAEVRKYKKELESHGIHQPGNPIPKALDEIEKAIEEAVYLQEKARRGSTS